MALKQPRHGRHDYLSGKMIRVIFKDPSVFQMALKDMSVCHDLSGQERDFKDCLFISLLVEILCTMP